MMRKMLHLLLLALLLLAATATAQAGQTFSAFLSGAQEVPPNNSTATGFARVTLNDAEDMVTIDLTFSGLSSAQTGAHVHGSQTSARGVNAPIVIPLPNGTFTGQNFAITPAQVALLKAGLLYINVHSTTFPGGEIRGQLEAGQTFVTNLTGSQEVPSNNSTATGFGRVTLNSAEDMITVTLTFTGLSSVQTGAHIHGSATSVRGVNAPVLIPLPNGTFVNQVFNIAPAQVALLKAGLLYINVHSTTFPGGEIRGQLQLQKPSDFDGEGLTDLATWTPATGNWSSINSLNGATQNVVLGVSTDVIVPGDYDGDGKTDRAVWTPSTGNWSVLRSSDSLVVFRQWGVSTDIPVPADYDGDGKTDLAVWRGAEGNWYIIYSTTNNTRLINWGTSTDRPVPSDYDGDGRADAAVFRNSEGAWYILQSGSNTVKLQGWGNSTDKLVPADYDGDGKADIAVYRPEDGNWYILKSTGGVTVTYLGVANDVAVPGDYDGDGKWDVALFRPAENNWYVFRSMTNSVNVQTFGAAGDVPVPSALVR